MDALFLSCLVAAALILAAWGRYTARKRRQRLQAHGYELILSLKSYSAWVDCQRDEPLMASDADELASPEPLSRARQLRAQWFPALSDHMLRLTESHRRLIEYLWQQNLLRLSEAGGWRPVHRDPQYQQIRGAQEELIEEMIELCQEIIGDRPRPWQRTGTDFAFSSSVSMSTTQSPAAGD